MSELLSPPQAGELLGRKRSAIIKWIHKRGLPATKLPSGQYLIQKDKFAAWLEEKGVKLPLNHLGGTMREMKARMKGNGN
jgi:excisionase family DNA binding protein